MAIELNGRPLQLNANGTVPMLNGEQREGANVFVAPHSVVFVSFAAILPNVCSTGP